MSHDIPGPAFEKSVNPQTAYSPVDCDFTDELEHLSVKKYPVKIFYFDSGGKNDEASGKIVDIVIKDKAEYVVLSNDTEIRLDRIQFIRSEYASQYKPKK